MEAARVPKKKSASKSSRSVAPKRTVEEVMMPPPPPLKLYRRIAGIFVLLVASVLAIVLFVSTTNATIRVTPQPQTVDIAFLVDVVRTAVTDGKIRGNLVSQTFESTKTVPVVQGEQKEVIGKAGGMVTLVNETGSAQPLVATTRLLSTGGVLFRIDTGVTVPANGSIEVMAHADQEGPTGDIGPDRFTIPGLSSSLQAVIYATTDTAMTGGKRMVSVLGQTEIDLAVQAMEDEMVQMAQTELIAGAGELTGKAFFPEVIALVVDKAAGVETDQFAITMKLQVTGVFYDETALWQTAEAKLYEQLERGYEFSTIPLENLEATVQGYDLDDGVAQLRVELSGASIVSATHPSLSVDQFAGKAPSEIANQLRGTGLASGVVVEIFPPWIGKVPTLKDHIRVIIEQP